ncbi:transposon ty3-i Gag-Pol polyprotein [Plakobranchus ocellatus]|uniref:Transposon ty3-i Gag-Pol polyprotein n=1 Tax=Plakobranchus ocellatus TaxID=259542 RepID=A0AAV4BUM9_9GAST|nr:transposon ty3-i Gag-Pol polyprotein [Plakobranchus ocellatus]
MELFMTEASTKVPDLIVAVDHRPLLKILMTYPSPSSARFKERRLRYRFRIVHVPGIRHTAADAISRHPVGKSTSFDLPDDVAAESAHCLQPL